MLQKIQSVSELMMKPIDDHWKDKLSHKNAFTLIELLVVISIIALLLAILLPALQKAREGGRAAVCQMNQKSIGIGFNAFDMSEGHLPQAMLEAPWEVPEERWHALLIPYLGQKLITGKGAKVACYICPSRQAIGRYNNVGNMASSKTGTGISWVDYGVNYGGSNGMFKLALAPGKPRRPGSRVTPTMTSVKIMEIRGPSNVFMMMDSVTRLRWGTVAWACEWVSAPWAVGCSRDPEIDQKTEWAFDTDYDKDGLLDSCERIMNVRAYSDWDFDKPMPYNGSDHERHGRGPIVLFADGHVKKVVTREWIQKKNWVW